MERGRVSGSILCEAKGNLHVYSRYREKGNEEIEFKYFSLGKKERDCFQDAASSTFFFTVSYAISFGT